MTRRNATEVTDAFEAAAEDERLSALGEDLLRVHESFRNYMLWRKSAAFQMRILLEHNKQLKLQAGSKEMSPFLISRHPRTQ